jgi:para-nitrobenzyl esterase
VRSFGLAAGMLAGIVASVLLPGPLLAADRVPVTGGIIEGTRLAGSEVRLFRGIPFAAPPVGERRWRAPQPVEPWDGIRKADTWGTRCMQGDMFGGPIVTRDDSMGEDCLYLNVWAPAKTTGKPLPVLVVFHGGGYAAGSASEPRTDGEWFARQGVIVVAPNYRLGLFGFLAHPELSAESDGRGSGNYGMLDQVAALQWVQDNIAAFGGDPGNVTINGESAGSTSVSALMASPLSRHMVHKAIGQSGAFFSVPLEGQVMKPLMSMEQDGLNFAHSIGADDLADLRAMPARQLLDEVMQQNGGWGYGPGVDGHFLSRPVEDIYKAGEQAAIPLMAGWTSAELGMAVALNPERPTVASFTARLEEQIGTRAADALEVYPAGDDREAMHSAAALASDLFISYSTWKWIETHRETADAPIYRYRFDRSLPDDPASQFGAIHASDIEYAFNTLDSKPSDWQAEDRRVAEVMATAIANFVRTGNPNGPGVPDWPAYGDSGKVMVFDSVSESRPEEYRARYEFLDSLMTEQ